MLDCSRGEDIIWVPDDLHTIGAAHPTQEGTHDRGQLGSHTEDDRVGRSHDGPDVGPDPVPAQEVLPGAQVVRHRGERDTRPVGPSPAGGAEATRARGRRLAHD